MKEKQTALGWQEYINTELPIVTDLVIKYGYLLSEEQPHLKGERFLMQAMTTNAGRKMILVGNDSLGQKVVIKATSDNSGKAELEHERTCRQVLHEVDFSYATFHSPRELAFIKESGYTISIHEFIEQESTFLDRPLEEQFSFSLRALKAQEQTRATTKKHFQKVALIFGNRTSNDYLDLFRNFTLPQENENLDSSVVDNLDKANSILRDNKERVEQYCGFLTHTDFVPHNFRIKNNDLYLLDFSSLRFGNKHESWARFLNFMTLYNPELERLLIQYVEDNRSPEERESLQLMRLFRLGEIISYYGDTIKKSEGDLHTLNQVRVKFWNNVLAAELKNQRVNRDIVEAYKKTRDELRSRDEKERQVGLH